MNTLRPRPLLALAAAVLALHLWLANGVLPPPLGGAPGDPLQRRFEVSFVHELQPSAVAPPPPAAPPARRVAQLAAAPAEIASAPAETPLPAVPAAEPLPDLPELPALADAAAGAASAPPGFAWPPSTRLRYRLSGDVRGPVHGQAQVEWLRQGTRYQVLLETSIGPSFAPLMTRRESSEGEITSRGLHPRRYDMTMDVVFRDQRRYSIVMDDDLVLLADGRTLPRPGDLQDTVSQFVQLTWLFTTQPARLHAGESVVLTLALPRRLEPWVYDVVASEPLQTTAGLVDTVHVRPRQTARVGDYTAEIWVAPALQNLPVRIVVRQDAQTYVDLQLEGLPEQAER